MKGHTRSVPTDVIAEPVDHNRKPNWLVRKRLQSALATVTSGRTFSRTSTIPLTEGLRFDLAFAEEGRLEFQGIARRAFVYRSGERNLIIRGMELVSKGLRYHIYSGPVLTRDVVTDYVTTGLLNAGFVPQRCSGSAHAVELAVYDSWKRTWIAPTWYSLGKNPDIVPASELTTEGEEARRARVPTMRADLSELIPDPYAVRPRYQLTRDDAIERTRILLGGRNFVVTTDIQPITSASRILQVADIAANVAHRLDENDIYVVYYLSGSQKTVRFPLSGFPDDRLWPLSDGYKAYLHTRSLVPASITHPQTTTHFAVISILDEHDKPVEHFICGIK